MDRQTADVRACSPPRKPRLAPLVAVAGWLLLPLVSIASGEEPVDYLRDVKPLLAERCYACHGALKQSGGLRLDTAAAARLGGDSGEVIIAGDPAESLLIGVVTGDAGYRMPPEGEGAELTAEQVDLLRRWIASGAAGPDDEVPQEDPYQYWSYQDLRRPEVPTVTDADWVRNPIDAFVAREHERHGLTASPEADQALLLRRVYLDLVGLPPTPAQLDAFLADSHPRAYERVVDELLNSPLYGQRWGRHWMDVWRYSDWYGSRGINQIRYGQRHAWRWRDWIVESLNADKGYDQLIREMIAGDELAPGDPEVVRATGFLGRNWYKFDRDVWMFDTVEHTAQAFLGLTLRCARCHDHKFDPISQEEYYRFRAFFEPHDVRTDPVSANLSTELDTGAPVLTEGVSLVYDKDPDVPTYLFQRGDSRYPDQSRRLEPGVPAALGGSLAPLAPVPLPVESYYPLLRRELVVARQDQLDAAIADAELAARRQWDQVARLEASLAQQPEAGAPAESRPEAERTEAAAGDVLLADDFTAARAELWKVVSGDWTYESERLVQSDTGHFRTLQSHFEHPRDFILRLKYRPLAAGQIHSVGLFFDAVNLMDAQAVYTALPGQRTTVQAFHRSGGQEHYPAAGIAEVPLQLGELITLDVAVRDAQLNVWVNGQLSLVYTMPTPRRTGTLALWTHSAAAEFHQLLCDPLPEDFELATSVDAGLSSPFAPPTRETLARQLELARQQLALGQRRIEVAQAERAWFSAVVEAERVKVAAEAGAEFTGTGSSPTSPETAVAERVAVSADASLDAPGGSDDGDTSTEPATAVDGVARAAGAAERRWNLAKATLAREEAEWNQRRAESQAYPDEAAREKALQQVRQALEAAEKEREKAEHQLAQPSDPTAYTALGPRYARQSSGRRTALAAWLADPENRRTARVAVNHLWLRHFGEGLVPTAANFGLSGQAPSHPELLDWLASELIEQQWSLKHLHRLMVLSSTYRMVSSEVAAEQNRDRDPGNRWLWRMNSRRLESEAIRDSVLHVAGQLDTTPGGPEIPESEGMTNLRRSMYFRSTPNEQMQFLELFDQANPNECYRRQESVIPQQALALNNSPLSLNAARQLAEELLGKVRSAEEGSETHAPFIAAAFQRILTRRPSPEEVAVCERFLDRQQRLFAQETRTPYPAAQGTVRPPAEEPVQRARENLVHVLLNHNDFVTIR